VRSNNARECPTPTGNWANTCYAAITIEGPCNGRCLLKATCRNLNKKTQETTMEYAQRQILDLKNVNGLLCRVVDDGPPQCGMNFHGNLAVKNCGRDTIPMRKERTSSALPLHPPEETDSKGLRERDGYYES
jgi:hypothetical protein